VHSGAFKKFDNGRLARAKIYEIEDAGDTLKVKKMEYF
jgi:hypothetical protein